MQCSKFSLIFTCVDDQDSSGLFSRIKNERNELKELKSFQKTGLDNKVQNSHPQFQNRPVKDSVDLNFLNA